MPMVLENNEPIVRVPPPPQLGNPIQRESKQVSKHV